VGLGPSVNVTNREVVDFGGVRTNGWRGLPRPNLKQAVEMLGIAPFDDPLRRGGDRRLGGTETGEK